MNRILKVLLVGLIVPCLQVLADPALADLEQSNPLGHRMLTGDDYLRYAPCSERLSGNFVPAYSGTSFHFLPVIMKRLERIHPQAAWGKQCHYYSSVGVLRCLLDGTATIGVSSWPMTSAQREDFVRRFGYPVLETRVALDALQILVHPDNPLNSITIPQLDAMYGTELRAGALDPIRTWDEADAFGWGENVPIRVHAGCAHYGTSLFFKEAVLQDGPWRDDLDIIDEISVLPEAVIARDPFGISFSSFRLRGDGVKVLSVARQTDEKPFPPTPKHIYGEEYPLTRFFYVYVNAPSVEEMQPEAREFLNYILSYEGQYEISKTGSLPLDMQMLLRARKRLDLPVP